MSESVTILGMDAVIRALELLDDPAASKLLQKATAAGGKALKPFIQAEAPVKTGRLRRSVSTRQARKARPATVVSPRPKVAFYRHFVIDGTRPHEIVIHNAVTPTGGHYTRVIHHPGAKANPFVDRGFARGESAALAAIEKVIDTALQEA
jgi:HK97 gp10 family phage protein